MIVYRLQGIFFFPRYYSFALRFWIPLGGSRVWQDGNLNLIQSRSLGFSSFEGQDVSLQGAKPYHGW